MKHHSRNTLRPGRRCILHGCQHFRHFRMPTLPISREACPFRWVTNQPLGVEVESIQGLEAIQDGQLGEASREGVMLNMSCIALNPAEIGSLDLHAS